MPFLKAKTNYICLPTLEWPLYRKITHDRNMQWKSNKLVFFRGNLPVSNEKCHWLTLDTSSLTCKQQIQKLKGPWNSLLRPVRLNTTFILLQILANSRQSSLLTEDLSSFGLRCLLPVTVVWILDIYLGQRKLA